MLSLRSSARTCGARVLGAAAALLILAAVAPALAQVVVGPRIVVNGTSPAGPATVALPEDRTVLRKLKLAKEQIDAKSYAEAVNLLGRLLESSEDYFFKPDPESKSHYSLRKELERLIGELPAEGRRHYDLRFGPAAQKLLTEALAAGDWRSLEEVTRRYFHSEAGYQAGWLLADYYLDQGEPLVAAKTLERLQKAPPKTLETLEPALSIKLAASWLLMQREDRAKAVLEQLSKTHRSASLTLAGQEIDLFAPGGEPLARLRKHLPELFQRAVSASEYLLARGDAARSGMGASHVTQVQRVWTAQHYGGGPAEESKEGNEQTIVEAIQRGVTLQRQQNQPVLPAAQPIVIGDLVVMRTATHLWALDCRREGYRLWPTAQDRDLLDLIEGKKGNFPANPEIIRGGRRLGAVNPYAANQTAIRDEVLRQRALFDATYGTLSSDGNYIFCVEGLDPIPFGYAGYIGGLPVSGQSLTSTTNRLSVYEIASQLRLMWELGGVKSTQEGAKNRPLAGSFFLGPPLPLAGRLYALTETNKQIAVQTIEQRKGAAPQPLWSQPLCGVELGVESDPTRRMAGLTPAHSDGILVCPTAAGAVVAVDLTTRSLLWAYTYGRDEYSTYGGLPPGAIVVGPGGARPHIGHGQGWADTGVVIAEGKVLVTERGSRYLHCLNLEDGSLAWKVDRQEGLFVGGVHDDTVLVVCPTGVRAYKMSNGAPAWAVAGTQPLGGAKVAGRGFHHSGVYILPLDNGRLASVEMKTGDVKLTQDKLTDDPVSTDGNIGLGNLVCVNGWLISQDLYGVLGFRQASLETLSEALKKNPDDVPSLIQLGELLRQKGRLDEAVPHLRRAAGLTKSWDTQRLVARALIEGLQTDFAKYRQQVSELDRLTTVPEAGELRAQYLRTYSDGLLAAGDHRAAFDAFLNLAQGDPHDAPLMPVGDSLALRSDRWLESRWARLLETAAPEARGEMEKAIAARFAAAQRDASPDALRLALAYFSNHPAAEAGRQRLAELLLAQNDKPRLEVELLLRGLERSTDRQKSAGAVAALAEFYRTALAHGFPAARHYYDRLKSELATVAGPGGKTGQQLFDEALAADEKFRDYLQPKPWPTGKITARSAYITGGPELPVRSLPTSAGVQTYIDTTLLADPLAGAYRYQIRGGCFIALSTGGREVWRVPLANVNKDGDPGIAGAVPTMAYGHRLAAHGHLLALVTGFEIIGIDASPGADDASRLLWRHSLTKLGESDDSRNLTPTPSIEIMPWGQSAFRYSSPQGDLGSLDPVVGAQQVSFLRGSELVTVDALSGDVLWKRGGIPLGSDLVGDDEHLVVMAPDQTKASVYRALDGELIGTRSVPPRAQRMAAFGCRVLCWSGGGEEKVTLKLVDVLAEKTLWSSEFSSSPKAAFAGPDEIGVLDVRGAAQSGRDAFQLISLADGKVRFSSLVVGAGVDAATGIHLLRSADRYVLAVTNAAQPAAGLRVPGRIAPTSYGNALGAAFILGRVYVIDRRTGKLVKDWEAPGIGLPLLQPPDSPVVAFVTTSYGVRTIGGAGGGLTRVPSYTTVAHFLDKRTGQIVHRESFSAQTNRTAETSLIVGPGHKVELQHQMSSLVLTFSGAAPDEKEREKIKGLDLSLGITVTPTPGAPAVPVRRGFLPGLPVPIPVEPAPVPALPR